MNLFQAINNSLDIALTQDPTAGKNTDQFNLSDDVYFNKEFSCF